VDEKEFASALTSYHIKVGSEVDDEVFWYTIGSVADSLLGEMSLRKTLPLDDSLTQRLILFI